MKKTIILIFAFLVSGNLLAQTNTKAEKELLTRPFQLSFITPLGTNGMESGRTINNVSINLMAGYSAGLDGVEFGGFANISRFDVNGVQMAGFLNCVGGSANAVQLAGFTNIVADSSIGTQASGFSNFSKNHQGIQMAGFGNFAGKKIEGVQLAGFINMAKETEGTQIAGFLNITQQLNGLQLGVVNIVDSVSEGTPVGIFSFVRNGYNHVEIWSNEMLHLNAGIKFGTAKFYNILAVGAEVLPVPQNNIMGIGYGIGHAFELTKGQFSLDLLSYQLMDIRKPFQNENGEFNQLSQLKFTYDFPAKHFSYYIGPSLNMLLQQKNQATEEGWNHGAPYSIYSNIEGDRKVQLWIGGQLGIRF